VGEAAGLALPTFAAPALPQSRSSARPCIFPWSVFISRASHTLIGREQPTSSTVLFLSRPLSSTAPATTSAAPTPQIPSPILRCSPPILLRHRSPSPAISMLLHLRCTLNSIFPFVLGARIIPFASRTRHTAKPKLPRYYLWAHITSKFLHGRVPNSRLAATPS
jgi:hypothetical protein